MFGIEITALPGLLMSVGLSACLPQAPAEIDVQVVQNPVRFNLETPGAELPFMDAENVETRDDMHGVTTSTVEIPEQQDAFLISWITDPRMGTSCLWYEKIALRIDLAQTVHLDNDIATDHCMREAAMEHQIRHVELDRKLVRSFAKQMELSLKHLAVTTGTVGPVPNDRIDQTRARLGALLQNKFSSEMRKFLESRMRWHAKIDTADDRALLFKSCEERNRIIESQQPLNAPVLNAPGQ